MMPNVAGPIVCEKPKRPIYIDAFSIWCPMCEAIDFTHDHEEMKVIGTPANVPTAAEHNWLVLNGGQLYGGLAARYGLVEASVKFGFKEEATR